MLDGFTTHVPCMEESYAEQILVSTSIVNCSTTAHNEHAAASRMSSCFPFVIDLIKAIPFRILGIVPYILICPCEHIDYTSSAGPLRSAVSLANPTTTSSTEYSPSSKPTELE